MSQPEYIMFTEYILLNYALRHGYIYVYIYIYIYIDRKRGGERGGRERETDRQREG